MRVLLIVPEPEAGADVARDLERAGHEVAIADVAHAVARVRAMAPRALVVRGPIATGDLRLLLARARSAAEAALPALLLLGDDSPWLRAPLPDDLAPAAALAVDSGPAAIARALEEMDGDRPARGGRIGEAMIEYASRRLSGPSGEAWLTPSEAAVLAALAREPGAFASTLDLARALWGEAVTDRHARGAIRSHIHTLRGKLVAAGVAATVEARSGVGYRLVL